MSKQAGCPGPWLNRRPEGVFDCKYQGTLHCLQILGCTSYIRYPWYIGWPAKVFHELVGRFVRQARINNWWSGIQNRNPQRWPRTKMQQESIEEFDSGWDDA